MARKKAPQHELETEPEPDDSDLGDVLEFMRLLWALDHGMQSTSKRMKATHGVTSPQRLVVRMVGRFPHISAGALARVMQLHPSTLTGVLDRLVSRGLLTRRADPEDARRALFQLTQAGKQLNQSQSGTMESAVRKLLGKLPRAQVNSAKRVLTALAHQLENSAAPAE